MILFALLYLFIASPVWGWVLFGILWGSLGIPFAFDGIFRACRSNQDPAADGPPDGAGLEPDAGAPAQISDEEAARKKKKHKKNKRKQDSKKEEKDKDSE
jgi:hypothetical protein